MESDLSMGNQKLNLEIEMSPKAWPILPILKNVNEATPNKQGITN